ncbi:DNA polymerase III subunit alpha [Plebeiibacterium sediminum]|uniref:DNA-directed DNA polymerase n=1 Tax=Plebeiibacterium sediminum TaxID=2992112 RepID=A0AAE3M148_9BACT|nr:DNA polymerase III subunit alpha [Plebeiobacterium sediminum]MCW3785339.1 DNA polymerase III subunit alpha [Plebeiobacterium sediminum]
MHLNTHTYYSLRYGILSPEDLAQQSSSLGIKVMVLTDINNSTGLFDFIKACREVGITALAGIEFRRNHKLLYIGIAKNNQGYMELNNFLTRHNLSNTELPYKPNSFDHVYFIYPYGSIQPKDLQENEFVGIQPLQLRKLISSSFRYQQHKLVVWQPATFSNEKGYALHRHLRAIDKNILLSQLTPEDTGQVSDILHSPDQIRQTYAQFPEIIKTTEELLKECSFDFDFTAIRNKKTFTGSFYDDKKLLEKLALDGMLYRYGANNIHARERIEKELHIINKLGFAAYFLITWDIIRYSMSRGFYHVGRGSGANSIVAFCLKITDVDPIKLNLYFERFLNPKRTSPPDFDIDYSWKEREEVQDYIFKRYGAKHTALLGAMSTFKGKSIIRELGKVYGLPKEEIDLMIDYPETAKDDQIKQNINHIGSLMTDFPNLRTIHAGGVLISEEPITCYTALDMPPKGFPTTQWDMYIAEDIGFEKLDILSQRGIGHIKDCTQIVLQNQGIDIDVHQVEKFMADEKVKDQLQNAETNGCFYIESPAMRGLLKKLQCNNYLTLVAASSIIRPGVARSGMMREYIQRFHQPNNISYLHPVMKEQLEETYGVMVYQEDVLKVCHHFAGLDLADADVLRRAMSGKYRSKKEFQRIVDKFFSNCRQKGYPDKIIHEVWRQIESFAGYSFSKAHSASYAVESFQSLYLKAHFPLEFMVAVINNFGGFYQTWVYVNEARRQGAIIHQPCVNNSFYTTSITGKDIYLGFIHVQNLESKIAQLIDFERQQNGSYKNLEDFIKRTGAGRESMVILIRTGALRFTGKSKSELLWEMHLLLTPGKKKPSSQSLFSLPQKKYQLPKLARSKVEDAYDEIELIGFPVTLSYFDLLETNFRGGLKATELIFHVGKRVRMIGQLVCIKYVRTVRKQLMHFATFIDVDGNFYDTTHFPPSLQAYPFKGYGMYLILGRITEEFGFASIEVEKMAKMPIIPDPRAA